ncbi:MAG: hypothetical protein ABI955_12395, partial [Nitrospirota bacterium]
SASCNITRLRGGSSCSLQFQGERILAEGGKQLQRAFLQLLAISSQLWSQGKVTRKFSYPWLKADC